MSGPSPALAAARGDVRRALSELGLGAAQPSSPHDLPAADAPLVLVACSGGTDSLALAAATAFVAPRLGLRVAAVIVDHGLQEGSARVASMAAGQLREVFSTGADPTAVVEVVTVEVEKTGRGPEADARAARYAALAATAERLGAEVVLLGHTLDDQAEQVLLGLARGSGARSLSGMAMLRELALDRGQERDFGASLGSETQPVLARSQARRAVLAVRPFLQLTRDQTAQVCADLGLRPWRDPHNQDRRFARVRARAAVRVLEDSLGPGVRAALARTADLLRDDADLLEELTVQAHLELGETPWEVRRLLELPRAVRTRLWRRAALAAGSPGTDLNAGHLLTVDSLLTHWHGQGPIQLPGGVRARRHQGRLWLGSEAASTMAP